MRKRRKRKQGTPAPPETPKDKLRKATHRFDTPEDVMRYLIDLWRNQLWKGGYIRLYRRNYVDNDWRRIVSSVQTLNARGAIEHYKTAKGSNALYVRPKVR